MLNLKKIDRRSFSLLTISPIVAACDRRRTRAYRAERTVEINFDNNNNVYNIQTHVTEALRYAFMLLIRPIDNNEHEWSNLRTFMGVRPMYGFCLGDNYSEGVNYSIANGLFLPINIAVFRLPEETQIFGGNFFDHMATGSTVHSVGSGIALPHMIRLIAHIHLDVGIYRIFIQPSQAIIETNKLHVIFRFGPNYGK